MGEIERIAGRYSPKQDACLSKCIIGGASEEFCSSLPPRKRLLAGLKQNDLLFSGFQTPSPSSVENVNMLSFAKDLNSSLFPRIDAYLGKSVTSCPKEDVASRLGCNCKDSNFQHDGSLLRRQCSSCVAFSSEEAFCFCCLRACKNSSLLSNPAVWLLCRTCQRFIHFNCECRFSPGVTVNSVTFTCFECRFSKYQHEDVLDGSKEKSSLNIRTSDDSAAGSCSSTISFEILNSSTKKKRTPRKRRTKLLLFGGSYMRPISNVRDCKNSTSSGVSISHQDDPAVSESKRAAVKAAKAAAIARAVASAKAAAAVKAAAIAKAALEAAAVAARAGAEAHAELHRRSAQTETSLATSVSVGSNERVLQQVVISDVGTNLKRKISQSFQLDASSHDKELSHQLHRTINNSPRTPHLKKTRLQSGFNMLSDHSATSTDQVSFFDSFHLYKLEGSEICPNSCPESKKPVLEIAKRRLDVDMFVQTSASPKNCSPISISPYTLGDEDPKQQAVEAKSENNLTTSCDNYFSCKSRPEGNLSINKLGREVAPPLNTIVGRFNQVVSENFSTGKVRLPNYEKLAVIMEGADLKLRKGIEGRYVSHSHMDSISAAHLPKKKEGKPSKGTSPVQECKDRVTCFKELYSWERSTTNEVGISHQTDGTLRKGDEKSVITISEGEKAMTNFPIFLSRLNHVNLDRFEPNVPFSAEIPKHGLTGAGIEISVSNVEFAMVLHESFSSNKTSSQLAPAELLHCAVSVVSHDCHC